MAPTRSRRRQAIALGALGLVAVIAAAVVVAIWRPVAPDHPDQWDARVLPFVEVVEDVTGEEFEHPTEVRFLEDAAFTDLVSDDVDELSDADRQAYDDAAAEGRALGLFSGASDLAEEQNDLLGAGVLAFYSFDDREIVVRLPEGVTEDEVVEADDLPIDVQVTIVHELVHALQDQLWDLDRLTAQAETDSAQVAVRSLIEGHATWVEYTYLFDELTQEDLDEYFRLYDEAGEEFEDATADISLVLQAAQSLPYVVGPAYVEALDGDGSDTIDTAFTDAPPVAEDQVLLPTAYLDGDEPEEIDAPEAPDDAEVVTDGQLGAAVLYLMLALGSPAPEALRTSDGWGNDAYVSYRDPDDDRVCVIAHVTGDDREATDALEAGLRAWADARPDEAGAAIERDGDVIVLTACDPGDDVDQAIPDDADVDQLFSRAQQLYFLLRDVGDVETAECVVRELYGTFPSADILEATDEVIDAYTELATSC